MVSPFVRALAPGTMGGYIPDFYNYKIDYSCRFNDDDSAYMSKAVQAMDDAKTWTISFWCKRGNLGSQMVLLDSGADTNNCTIAYFDATNKLNLIHLDSSATTDHMQTTQVFRDTTNWYHIVIRYDSTDGTAGDRQRMFVNGTEVTAWDTDNQAAENKESDWGNSTLYLGCRQNTTQFFDGYLAEFYFIDGYALDADSFGQFKYFLITGVA